MRCGTLMLCWQVTFCRKSKAWWQEMERARTVRGQLDRQVNMRTSDAWVSIRRTLQFGQGMSFHELRLQSTHLSHSYELYINSLHSGAPLPSPGSGKAVRALKGQLSLGLWGSFLHCAMATSLLKIFCSPLCSSISNSQVPYNIASRNICLRNKSSHVLVQLWNWHYKQKELGIPQKGKKKQSLCDTKEVLLGPQLFLVISAPPALLLLACFLLNFLGSIKITKKCKNLSS